MAKTFDPLRWARFFEADLAGAGAAAPSAAPALADSFSDFFDLVFLTLVTSFSPSSG